MILRPLFITTTVSGLASTVSIRFSLTRIVRPSILVISITVVPPSRSKNRNNFSIYNVLKTFYHAKSPFVRKKMFEISVYEILFQNVALFLKFIFKPHLVYTDAFIIQHIVVSLNLFLIICVIFINCSLYI